MATKRHDCAWRRSADELEAKLAEQSAKLDERDPQLSALRARVDQIEHKLALATKQIIGPKTERMPHAGGRGEEARGRQAGARRLHESQEA